MNDKIRNIKMDIIDKAEIMARIIAKDKDIELRKGKYGVKVVEVSKTQIS